MKKLFILTIFYFTSLSCFSQEVAKFGFSMLQKENTRLDLNEKIYLKNYFTNINYKEAKEAFLNGALPVITDAKTIKRALNPPDITHLKRDFSKSPFGIIDKEYYESLPLTSVMKLAKAYYSEFVEIEKAQEENMRNISKAIKVSMTPHFLKIQDNKVSFDFTVYNLGLKDIETAYGNVTVVDNYGNILIQGNYALDSGPYEALSVYQYKDLLEQKIWSNSNVFVMTEVDDYTVKKLKEIGSSNLLLKYEPNRIIYSDGTNLIK
jgi:hypothetical protein